jgi:hypothetical protein
MKACIELGMALIVQVWWGFQTDVSTSFPSSPVACPLILPSRQQNLWRKGQESIYEVFENSIYSKIAPYVVYSASFGSEPIGDWVDGDNFIDDLSSFRTKVSLLCSVSPIDPVNPSSLATTPQMKSLGVPVGVSEDWDRPNRMKQGSAVIDIGAAVLNNTDVAQLHVMPYCKLVLARSRTETSCVNFVSISTDHPDEARTVHDSWDYIKQQVQWYVEYSSSV